jgi:Uma2 family endonuclease
MNIRIASKKLDKKLYNCNTRKLFTMNMLEELGTIVLDTHHLGSFTDDEYYNFCLDNPNLRFKRDTQGEIYIRSKTQFPRICQEFVVELNSPNDQLEMFVAKMNEYVAAGAKLAWLIDHEPQKTLVFKENQKSIEIPFDSKPNGGEVLNGFEVVLSKLFS